MKNLIFTCLASSLLINNIYAGDREWSTAGKILTGAAIVTVVDRIVNQPPPVVYQQPVIVQSPVVVQPHPIIIQTVPVYCPTPVIVYHPYYHYGYHGHYWRRY